MQTSINKHSLTNQTIGQTDINNSTVRTLKILMIHLLLRKTDLMHNPSYGLTYIVRRGATLIILCLINIGITMISNIKLLNRGS